MSNLLGQLHVARNLQYNVKADHSIYGHAIRHANSNTLSVRCNVNNRLDINRLAPHSNRIATEAINMCNTRNK